MQSEAGVEGVLWEKAFLEISQNSQGNTCARVSFFPNLLRERLWYRYIPKNFAKFIRIPFLQNTYRAFWTSECFDICENKKKMLKKVNKNL